VTEQGTRPAELTLVYVTTMTHYVPCNSIPNVRYKRVDIVIYGRVT
jgi:hypothetical protein